MNICLSIELTSIWGQCKYHAWLKIYKSIIGVDLHCSFTNGRWLSRTCMLLVYECQFCLHKSHESANTWVGAFPLWCMNRTFLFYCNQCQICCNRSCHPVRHATKFPLPLFIGWHQLLTTISELTECEGGPNGQHSLRMGIMQFEGEIRIGRGYHEECEVDGGRAPSRNPCSPVPGNIWHEGWCGL